MATNKIEVVQIIIGRLDVLLFFCRDGVKKGLFVLIFQLAASFKQDVRHLHLLLVRGK